jgi:hypothetical protein
MEKYSKTKRIITPIEIIYRSGKDIMKLSNSTHFQSVIMEDAFKSIKEAINKKWKKVELFNITNLSVIVEISSPAFPTALKKISNYYEKHEEYEKCAEIKQLLNKLKL